MPATTTASAICDRTIAVIGALTPTSIVTRFLAYRNEGDADFEQWAVANSAACLRRFQAITVGSDRPVEVSNTDVESHYVDMTVTVAYAQNARAGKDWALSRHRIIDEDRHMIEGAIGLRGGVNFAGSNPNATWVSGTVERQSLNGIDFLVIKQTMLYYRAMS